MSFAENPAVSHFDGDRESDISPRNEWFGSAGTVHTGMVSVTDTIMPSHITLSVARDAKGNGAVDRRDSDDDKDGDDEGSVQIAHDEWV